MTSTRDGGTGDTVNGGGGADTIHDDSAGGDTLNGGGDPGDTLTYAGEAGPVDDQSRRVARQHGQDLRASSTRRAATATTRSTGRRGNVINGGPGNDEIDGGGGTGDTVNGGSGADTIHDDSAGGDTLNGGGDPGDTLSYAGEPGPTTINLDGSPGSTDNDPGLRQRDGQQWYRHDRRHRRATNVINGGPGNDDIDRSGGHGDTVNGGSDADTIRDDSAGGDTLDGGGDRGRHDELRR